MWEADRAAGSLVAKKPDHIRSRKVVLSSTTVKNVADRERDFSLVPVVTVE